MRENAQCMRIYIYICKYMRANVQSVHRKKFFHHSDETCVEMVNGRYGREPSSCAGRSRPREQWREIGGEKKRSIGRYQRFVYRQRDFLTLKIRSRRTESPGNDIWTFCVQVGNNKVEFLFSLFNTRQNYFFARRAQYILINFSFWCARENDDNWEFLT